MIAGGANVAISSSGEAVPIEMLRAGSNIFCPISGSFRPVKSIKKNYFLLSGAQDIGITPYVINPGGLFKGMPNKITYVSGGQIIILPKKDNKISRIALKEVRADSVGQPLKNNNTPPHGGKIVFFSIEMEKKTILEINGMLIKSE